MSLYNFKAHFYTAFHPSDLGSRLVAFKFHNPSDLLQDLIRDFEVMFCTGVSCIRCRWFMSPPLLGSVRIFRLTTSPTLNELKALALNF